MAKKILKSKSSIKSKILLKKKQAPKISPLKKILAITRPKKKQQAKRKPLAAIKPQKKQKSEPRLLTALKPKKRQRSIQRLTSPTSNKNIILAPSSAEYIPVQKPKLRKYVNVEDSTLPDLSDKTRLKLIARDPHWVHAYWKVAPATMQEAEKNLGASFHQARHVLRMHDVTAIDFNGRNANRTFDIEVSPQAQAWYVDSWQDNVSYCAQLGLATEKGEFYPLAESNFVHTPRLSLSDRGDTMWMDVKPGSQKLPFVLTGKSRGRTFLGQRRRYLTEDDIRAYYSKLFPLLRRILGKRLKRYGKNIRIGTIDDIEDSEDFLMNLSGSRWFRKILLGASEEMVESGEEGARRVGAIGASESLTSMGGASEQVGKKRKFFFELGTELIVYGRTEPDAEVWHGQKQIPLRPDGTFSMRFALPDDGFIPLDFKAIAHDKLELREILTSGKRSKTHYQTKFL